jgi:hypothetical protein
MKKKNESTPKPVIEFISTSERTMMASAYQAVRESLSNQSSDYMRKQADAKLKELLSVNPCRNLSIEDGADYHMEGEAGLYSFKTYRVIERNGSKSRCVFDTRSLIAKQHGKNRTRTNGAHELYLLVGPSIRSNRESAELFARIRHQQKGLAVMTLRDYMEKEGAAIEVAYQEKAQAILAEQKATSSAEMRFPLVATEPTAIEAAFDVAEVPDELRKEAAANTVPYSPPATTVNVTGDTVFVKKQKEERSENAAPRKNRDRKTVSSCTATVAFLGQMILLATRSYVSLLPLVLATLKTNNLTQLHICFLADGEKKLTDVFMPGLKKMVAFVYQVLDWQHLVMRCAQELSMSIKGKDLRNQYLAKLKHVLWHGCVDSAIRLLEEIPDAHVKNRKQFKCLIEYLTNRRGQIPVYSVRKALGLANSSNAVEKANDRLVSHRQKGKGMSWSQDGSSALANVRLLKCNGQISRWVELREVTLELAAA